jgi:hypothetical protein
MKNRNSLREIAFHTLFCMVSMVSILLTMQKKYTSENDPLQAQITMREFQFFELIIEKINYCYYILLLRVIQCTQRYTRISLPCNVAVVDLRSFFLFPKLLNFLLCRIRYW